MIQIGLLWFDDDPRRPLTQKVDLAVRRFRERLGRAPDVCQLHPTQAAALAGQKATDLPPLRLVPDATLRPNYFLVGTEDEAASVEPAWAAALAETHEAVSSRQIGQPEPAGAGRKRGRAAAPRAVATRAQTDQPERTFVAQTIRAKTPATTRSDATTVAASPKAPSAVSAPTSIRARSRPRTTDPVTPVTPSMPPRRTRARSASQAPESVSARGRQLAIVQVPLPLDAVPTVPAPAAPRKRRTVPPALPPTARSNQRTRGRTTATDSGPGDTGAQRAQQDRHVAPRPRTREWEPRPARQKPATPAGPRAPEAHPRRHRHAS